MATLAPDPDGEARSAPDREPTRRTPRWVVLLGIIAAVLVALFVIVMLTGGGGEHGPGRHTSTGDTGAQTSRSGATGGVGAPAEVEEATRTIEVRTLDSMTFEPSMIDVAAGETVTFVVTNIGEAVHEFTLGDAAMQQEHADAMSHGMAHDAPNSISVRRGETKQLTWRFGDAAPLEYGCHEPGHYDAGMRGEITITRP